MADVNEPVDPKVKAEVQTLARTMTTVNLLLSGGLPPSAIAVHLETVREVIDRVLPQLRAYGYGGESFAVETSIRPGLAKLIAEAINSPVPDSPEGLENWPDGR